MNILFMSLGRYNSVSENEIYTDTLREFIKNGHKIYIVSPSSDDSQKQFYTIDEPDCSILKVNVGQVQKVGIIKKGINTLLVCPRFLRAIKKSFVGIHFDLVLYPTPPITLYKVVKYIKKRDNAKTYLMLKDIFPQNAVDIGMMTTGGLKGFIYKYFRREERNLYKISDKIGCMSPANVSYLLAHNPEISADKVEVCPNTIEIENNSISSAERDEMRDKYGLPSDKLVLIYGGNLGQPQGIDFMLKCFKSQMKNNNVCFLVVGDGTEFSKIQAFVDKFKPQNLKLMKRLPPEDYDRLVSACDIGLIFLDHRFTIPNFPSRLLGYLKTGLPVLACTDTNTDIGKVITDGEFGWWCESNDVSAFSSILSEINSSDLSTLGDNAFKYLCKNYSSEIAYNIINNSIKNIKQ